jgi:ADP-heptose:LPS heptosyltransferase
MKKKVIRIIAWGGLGDILLSTPCLKALKMQNGNVRIVVFCGSKGYMEIYKGNPNIDQLNSTFFLNNPLESIYFKFKLRKFHSCNYGRLMPSIHYKKNASEIIGEILGLKLEQTRLQVFLDENEERAAQQTLAKFKNPIILQINPNFSQNKAWPLGNWEELIRRMPEYSFIHLGLATEDKVEGAIDFRGRTTFREALAYVKNALSLVGVDSSLAHAANAFNIPGVVLFGASNPEVWGHDSNINIYKAFRCSPCIDILLNSKCPYNKPCMAAISVEEVKEALLTQIIKRRAGSDPYFTKNL